MATPIRLISTDFDGTLHADHETPPIPADLQELIGRMQSQGARWVINTGRDLSSLMEALGRARVSIKPDYVVAVEREIYRHCEMKYEPDAVWNDTCHRRHAELFARVRPDLERLTKWVNARGCATVYEDSYSPFCLIAETLAEADAVHEFLLEYCQSIEGLTVVRNDVYARFSHVDYNKGRALAELARQLGIGRESILAAGDHFNDLSMLDGRFAACVVAPDNAIAEVKELVRKVGGYVSHQPWGHGVARGLEHYLGLESAPRPLTSS